MDQSTHVLESQGMEAECNNYTYPTCHHSRSFSPADAQPPSRRSPSDHVRDQTSSDQDDLSDTTTFGPHSSAASSFAGGAQGLAPRPPSCERPRLATAFPTTAAEVVAATAATAIADWAAGSSKLDLGPAASMHRFKQDAPMTRPPPSAEQPERSLMESALPASNDSPSGAWSGPPVSYRQPPAHITDQPYIRTHLHIPAHSSSSAASHERTPDLLPSLSAADNEMDGEGHYTIRRKDSKELAGQQMHHATGTKAIEVPDMMAEDVAPELRPGGYATGAPDRRKTFANDRSPLQRLELTLDSMTKEEKRARVQAAEQRARQRAARRLAGSFANAPNEPQDRRPPAIQQSYTSHATPLTLSGSESGQGPGHRGEQEQRNPPRRHQPGVAHHPPQTMTSTVVTPRQAVSKTKEHEPSMPERNLSFRARAARNDLHSSQSLPRDPPAAFFTGGHDGILPVTHDENDLPREDLRPGRHQSPQGTFPTREEGSFPVVGKPMAPRPHPVDKNKELPPLLPSPQPERGVQHTSRYVPGGEIRSDEKRPGPVSFDDILPKPELAAVATQPQRKSQPGNGRAESLPQSANSHMVFQNTDDLLPDGGLYKPPIWLDEYQRATTGSLSGSLLEVDDKPASEERDLNKAWWETGGRGKTSAYPSRARKVGALAGQYDDASAPTRFKPALYLRCGPLLRYCGIRQEKAAPQTHGAGRFDRDIWRGSIMIVTQDSESTYDIVPMLRLFVQDISLLPPPPHQVNGDLPPEYVDPVAGHPKLGRRGETLYVRPVEHLEEAKDLSFDETDNGLFEQSRSPSDALLPNDSSELPQSFAGRQKRSHIDGEKLQKYRDVRGFRLHAERGCTFWRFNVEIELKAKQQRVAYRINRGPCMAFWVPPQAHTMNMMFHSCNGFSAGIDTNQLSGPDPMWRDVLNTHQSQPFHVMIGGGDQIYNDAASHRCPLFDEWLDIQDLQDKTRAPFTAKMQNEMENFYLDNYCTWFSRGLFALAASQIPMVNMFDDHDIFDGYGSYPDKFMRSPVFSGLGAVAFKYYMLFQHQSVPTETENMEPSWILGQEPGPYIQEVSRSVCVSLGGKVALLAVDCRTERTEDEVVNENTWEKIMNRLYAELRRDQTEHLLVSLGVPIAYPRLVWLENILTSRVMGPVKALCRTGMFGKALNDIDGGVEILDDLNDHWTTKNHKQERRTIIEDLQDLAIDKSLRITVLSGDVHLAAVGQFCSNTRLRINKHQDPRYMLNVVSSAIANTPPSNMLADLLNKRNKVHHFDKETDESMVPLFHHGVDGKPRNNKHLLPHRNWCCIRAWSPGMTPPPTPPPPPSLGHSRSLSPYHVANDDASAEDGGAGGLLFRRPSVRRRNSVPDQPAGGQTPARGDRPPVSGGMGGLFRSLSRRRSSNGPKPAKLTRTTSLNSGEGKRRGTFNLLRQGSSSRPDDGGINGQWGEDSDEELRSPSTKRPWASRPSGPRPEADKENKEYSDDDEAYFTTRLPQRAKTVSAREWTEKQRGDEESQLLRPRPFHRTPTGLSTKQLRNAAQYEVDLEGGLDICLNVEVNAQDPAGITVPYRLLVPRLHYEYNSAKDELPQRSKQTRQPSGFKKLMSFRRKPKEPKSRFQQEIEDDFNNDVDWPSDASSSLVPRQRMTQFAGVLPAKQESRAV